MWSIDLFGRTVAGHLQPLLLPVEEQHGDDEDDDDEQKRRQYPRRRLVDVGHLRLAGVVLPRAGGVWRGERNREETVSIPAVFISMTTAPVIRLIYLNSF